MQNKLLPYHSVILKNYNKSLPFNNALNMLKIYEFRDDSKKKTSTSNVCRRIILTTKVDPRTVREEIFLMAVDP